MSKPYDQIIEHSRTALKTRIFGINIDQNIRKNLMKQANRAQTLLDMEVIHRACDTLIKRA